MIALSHLHKYYSDFHALKDINLSVLPGEIMGVIGRSGAGKSTLLRSVNLLEKPTQGSVVVNNTDLMSLSPRTLRIARHNIGMIFQHFNLLSTRTVYENIAFPLRLLKEKRATIKVRVLALLEKVGLLHHQAHYPHQLSGGQKQRVAIARALATKPKVLLCDEMTSALDPETTEDILQLLRALNDEMKMSVLCITHEMSVIRAIADRVAVMERGRIVECQPVVDIFKSPQHAITKRFVATVFKAKLPESLQAQIHEACMPGDLLVLRLSFAGASTLSPVIDELARKTKIRVSILQANMEWCHGEMLGCMTVAIDLCNKPFTAVQAFLQVRGLTIEVMGYVDGQHWLD